MKFVRNLLLALLMIGGFSQLASADDNTMVLELKDDGIGISPDLSRATGMGLRIMHYRAAVIGGSLAIRRGPSGGTTVTCSIRQPNAVAVGNSK